MTYITLDIAESILSLTSASCAIEVLAYDLSYAASPVDPKQIKDSVKETLEPVGDLFTPPLKDLDTEPGQFRGALRNGQVNGLYDSDYRPLVTRDEASQIFCDRIKGFGATSIDALFEAIEVVNRHRAEESPDAVDEIISISTEEEVTNDESAMLTDEEAPYLTTEDIEGLVDCLESAAFERFVNTIENFIDTAREHQSVAMSSQERKQIHDSLRTAIKGTCELM